jgi:hypothetical protein
VVLLDGELAVRSFSHQFIDRDEVWDIVEKIEVVNNKKLNKLPREDRLCTTVTRSSRDGITDPPLL